MPSGNLPTISNAGKRSQREERGDIEGVLFPPIEGPTLSSRPDEIQESCEPESANLFGDILRDQQTRKPFRNLPAGISSKYFTIAFQPKNTRVVENVSLATILNTMQKCIAPLAIIRWKLAIRLVLDRKYLEDVTTKDERPYVVFMRERKKPMFPAVLIPQYIMLNTKNSLVISIIIRNILSLPHVQRTRKHLETLDELLRKQNMIGKYTKEFRYLLYDICSYEIHDSNKVIVQPTSTAQYQYITLQGIAKCQTMPHIRRLAALYPNGTKQKSKSNENSDSKEPLSLWLMTAGEPFGEFGSIKEVEFRAANIMIVSLTQLHLLSFEKGAMYGIVQDLEKKFTEKQLWLQSIPGFRGLPRYTIDMIARTGFMRKYSCKACIVRSGDAGSNNNMHFLMSGETTAYKLSAFIKRQSVKSTFFRPRFTLFPYDVNRLVSPSEGIKFDYNRMEDIVFELVPIGTLPTKSFFPHGLEMRGNEKDNKRKAVREALESNVFDKYTVVVGSAFTGAGYCQGSFDYDGGFSGGGSCECFVISRKDLISIVGGIAKLEAVLAEMPSMPDINERELQQKFLASKGWATA